MPDLSDIIERTLSAHADRIVAPDRLDEIVDRSPVVSPTRGQRHTRTPRVVTLAAAVVVVCGVAAGATLLAVRDDAPHPADQPAATTASTQTTTPTTMTPSPDDQPTTPLSWQPSGTEFPLVDHGPTSTTSSGPVVAALTRGIGVAGHPDQIVSRSLQYTGQTTAAEMACTSEQGSSGCRYFDLQPWTLGLTSSTDNGFADFNLLTVDGLPPTVAFVSYGDGDDALWQRPIAGFAAFPVSPKGQSVAPIGYDSTGREIARYGFDEESAAAKSVKLLPMADISQAQFDVLQTLTDDSMSACLTDSGGTINDLNIATFAPDVDQIAIWQTCVTAVQTTITAAVEALNVRIYDPVTERPTNPESPFHYGDSPTATTIQGPSTT